MQTAIDDKTETPTDNINKYLKKNREFWETFTPPESELTEGAIFVDLLIETPGYLLGNVISAKYIQKQTKKKLYGIARSETSHLSRAIAHSFDIPELIFVECDFKVNINTDLRSLFEGKSLEDQRKELLNFSMGNVVLGDLIYDQYLRMTGLGTIEEIDNKLINIMAATIRNFLFFDAAIKQFNVDSTVQGHIVYAQYGTLARAIIANGGMVYGKKDSAGPFTIRQYHDLESLKSHEFNVSQAEFDSVYNTKKDVAVKAAKDFIEARISSPTAPAAMDGVDAYSPDKKIYSKNELCDILGLDASKPCVFVMSHVFPDAVHNSSYFLYDDYLQWLRATLEIIKDVKDVNWIVKPHPDNKHFKSLHSVTDETLPYVNRYDHIKITPQDINTLTLHNVADAVITGNGTAGLEFPTKGIPSVVAGAAFYTNLGFSIEPKSQDEYKQVLTNIGALRPLPKEVQEKALVCAYIYYILCRVNSNLIPELPKHFWSGSDDNVIWGEAYKRLDDFDVEKDPLFNSIKAQLTGNKEHLWSEY